jgi:hypothetical protein
MAELVDALASGASDRKVVEVQVLFWAPYSGSTQYKEVSKAQQMLGFLLSGVLTNPVASIAIPAKPE